MTIRRFKDSRLEAILERQAPKGFPADLLSMTRRKLLMLDSASTLVDLRLPPRLEALKADRAGQCSIA